MTLTRGCSLGLFAAALIACSGDLGGQAEPETGETGGTGGSSQGGGPTTAGSGGSAASGGAASGGTASGGAAPGGASGAGAGGKAAPAYPFEPTTVRTYVGKVKNVMTGLAPTDDEIQAVETDPKELRGLIDQWFVTPEAQLKLRAFYANAFQQSQPVEIDMSAQIAYPATNGTLGARMMQVVRESFPRTVQKIVADGKPLTEAITTHTVMMTPALMAFYLMADDVLLSDDNKRSRRHPTPDGKLKMWLEFTPPEKGAAITLAQSLDPNDKARFMHFAMDAPYTCQVPKVDATGHVVYDAMGKVTYDSKSFNVLAYNVDADTADDRVELKLWQRLVTGSVTAATGGQKKVLPTDLPVPADVDVNKAGDYKVKCPFSWASKPLVTEDDFKWRPVTIRQPNAGETLTAFWELPKLRIKDEVVVRTQRVGFFSTPAFLGTFPSNQSNQSRVTANQALIVATGHSINPVDKGASTVLDTGKDGSHSDPNSPCYGCHQTMDPMRNVFLRAWTYSYSQQFDANHLFVQSTFDFGGVTKDNVDTLDDLASVLATHPYFAPAMTQKLCYYVNSAPCSSNDPEFLRVAKVFSDSNFNFQALVRELLSSPLVTGATETQTLTDRGEVVTVARYNHLCASITNRLNLADKLGVDGNICSGVAPTGASDALKAKAKTVAAQLASNLPSDGFARGAEGPLLSTSSTMFFRSASESLCQLAADFAVDLPDSRYQSDKKDQAITDLVSNIMGLTANDPARAEALAILQAHYDEALKVPGAKPVDALKSTVTLACSAPTSVTIGL